MRATTRTATVLTCAALALAALTACSDDDSGDTATPVETTSGAPATDDVEPSRSASPTDDSGDDDESDDDSGSDDCRTSDVSAELRDLDSAPGRRYAEIVLENVSEQPCTVEGYGGLALQDADRTRIPTDLVRMTRPAARKIVLDPGGAAASEISFSVVATDADSQRGPCQPEPSFVLVTPPDETKSTRIAWNLGPVCDEGRIEQKAYQPAEG